MGNCFQDGGATDQNYSNSARVTAWIQAPAVSGDHAADIVGLINELQALLSEYRAGTTFYSPYAQGYPQPTLNEALSQEIVERIDIHNYYNNPVEKFASVRISPGLPRESITMFSLSCYIEPGGYYQMGETANSLAHFVKHCFAQLNGDSAFVSMSTMTPERIATGDNPAATALEIDRRVKLASADLWHRFVRGAFWGNGLGPELCNRLGGQTKVLQDAPVFRAEPNAKGVWLQLSESFPPKVDEVNRLETYLLPLLEWTI